jgi:hypothetical protein
MSKEFWFRVIRLKKSKIQKKNENSKKPSKK